MKLLITTTVLLLAATSFGQDFTDTVAYKTGMIRQANILQVKNSTIKYEYKNDYGKTVKTSARKGMLEWYTFDGVRDNFESEFNAENLGYQDTIYFKSGEVRYVRVLKETFASFKYEFVNNEGRISKGVVRKDMVNKVIIGDPDSDIAKDFESKTPRNMD